MPAGDHCWDSNFQGQRQPVKKSKRRPGRLSILLPCPPGTATTHPMWTTPSRADILNTRANGIIIFTTKTAARPPSPHHLRVVSSQLPKRRSEQRLFPHHHHLSYHRRRRCQVTAESHDGDLRRAASINVVPVSPAQTTPDTCIFESFLAAALFVHQARTLTASSHRHYSVFLSIVCACDRQCPSVSGRAFALLDFTAALTAGLQPPTPSGRCPVVSNARHSRYCKSRNFSPGCTQQRLNWQSRQDA
ncbi:uncharacterized protein BKA78DRAFT_100777 [Phyllosticta capitalensis]|uniref:uncharacterized protein n=1 Tax=Phyllosticta capitalensis TaxID=121624 RepID=UPI00313108A9